MKNNISQLNLQLDDFLPTKIYLKLFYVTGTIKRYQSNSSKRIFRKLKAIDFQKGVIKMTYGLRETKQGKLEVFDNETVPLTKEKLIQAYYAFLGN